jgi:hypothetical protein
MLIKLKVSAKVSDGAWESPGAIIELDDLEAKRLFKIGAAERPNQIELGSDSTTYSAEEMDDIISALTDIDGISEKLVGDLIEVGLVTINDIAECSLEELVVIKGVGASTALKMIESAKSIMRSL